MNTNTLSFQTAYDDYYTKVKQAAIAGSEVLEVGGGAHPSTSNRSEVNYTIVDPDKKELDKTPIDIKRLYCSLQDIRENKQYDLIISKMVLEHVEHPDSFHKKIYELLSKGGKAIHFFACRNSLPALFNRFLPESIGDSILKLLKNRELTESPKYEAYYNRTIGHSKSQLQYFESMGYKIEMYNSYLGHTYCAKIPLLREVEQMYTWLMAKLKLKSFATVALVVLSKK